MSAFKRQAAVTGIVLAATFVLWVMGFDLRLERSVINGALLGVYLYLSGVTFSIYGNES